MAEGDDDDATGADAPGLDVVVPRAPTPDGRGVQVVRFTDATVELGEVRPVEPNRPVHGEVVRLTPRDDVPAWNVEVLVRRPQATAPRARSGPPQIATAAYRRNWQTIFGAPDADDAAVDPDLARALPEPQLN